MFRSSESKLNYHPAVKISCHLRFLQYVSLLASEGHIHEDPDAGRPITVCEAQQLQQLHRI